MEDATGFKSVLNIARIICGFIAEGHCSTGQRISGVTFSVSTSVVTVRPFEETPDMEKLEERTGALYQALGTEGAQVLTVKVFSQGMTYTHHFDEKGKTITQEKDCTPEGALFRVDMGESNGILLKDVPLFCSAVGPVIIPLLDPSAKNDLFLNGERIAFQGASE